MANASSKKFGAGQQDQGKGDGSGGMAPLEPDAPLPVEVLSNRDTSVSYTHLTLPTILLV